MSVEPVVVILKLTTGEEVIAIICGEDDGKIMLEHPHYIQYNHTHGTVAMLPFCALSDEKYYEIPKADTRFVVTANQDISSKFFNMVDSIEAVQTRELLEFEKPLDQLEAGLRQTTFIEGNDTKH